MFFSITNLSSNAATKIIVEKNAGTACRVTSTIRMLPPQVIYQRVSPQATSGSTWSSGYYYAPRATSVRAKTSKKKTVRDFKGKNGNIIKGFLVSIHATNKTAKIKSTKGPTYTIPIQSFSSSDISYMQSWWRNKQGENWRKSSKHGG